MSEASPVFSERDFYLREFRGRTLAFALPSPPAALGALAATTQTLRENGARSVVIAPRGDFAGGLGAGRPLAACSERIEARVWRRLHENGCALVTVPDAAAFAPSCRELAVRLGLWKLVWIDAGGGLRDPHGRRVSFLDREALAGLPAAAQGDAALRQELWHEIGALLDAGVDAVNVCDLAGLDDELFSYAGSGTLFTRERYVHVRRLGVDDYDAAHDLLRRGVAEGFLAPRAPEQVDAILASGFGAFVDERHLAGMGALLVHEEGGGGELASFYTLTRFLGEGIGPYLIGFALERARECRLGFVFACTTSERAGAFFEREGFRVARPEEIPESKWRDYDPARRERLRCYRREV